MQRKKNPSSWLGRPATAASVREAAKTIEDRCTFEAYERVQSLLVPTGAALIVGAFGASKVGALLPSMPAADQRVVGDFLDRAIGIITKDLVDTHYGDTHVMAMLLLVAFVAAGAVVLHRSHGLRDEFVAVHPYIAPRSNGAQMHQVAGFIARDLLGAWAVARARRCFASVAEKDGE